MLVTEDLEEALARIDTIVRRGMIGSLRATTPVIVQGITGPDGTQPRGADAGLRHEYCRRHIDPRRHEGGRRRPGFRHPAAEAVLATGAVASVAMAPPKETLAAVQEALTAGIKLIVTVAEGVPLHDAMKIGRAVRRAGATGSAPRRPAWQSLASASSGSCRMFACVPVRSGSCRRAARCPTRSATGLRAKAWAKLWIGVGGDPVKGVRFADLLPVFFSDAHQGIVLVGEVGGTEEEECADAYAARVESRSMP